MHAARNAISRCQKRFGKKFEGFMTGVFIELERVLLPDGKICTIHRTLAIRHSSPGGSVFPQSAIDFQQYSCHAPGAVFSVVQLRAKLVAAIIWRPAQACGA
jgi:hypothetical protein